MDASALYPIGELARRTGTTIKTLRFYSDRGLIPPADRSGAGYRLYDDDAVARVELVRTLRDLGLDLANIEKVMDRTLELRDVAATHAEALDVQIRVLHLRRAVLTAVAARGATLEETRLMHELAKLTDLERRRLIEDFLDAVFGGLRDDDGFAGVAGSMTPELPEDPTGAQVRAWVELAELTREPGFRAHVRDEAGRQAAERVPGAPPSLSRDLAAVVRDQTAAAVAADLDPASREADPVVSVLVARCAPILGCPDGAAARKRLLDRVEGMNDPRRDRYFALLAVVNDWPPPETMQPVLDWAARALRARCGG